MTSDPLQALGRFAAHLTPAARVLCVPTPSDSFAPHWLRAHGFDVEELDAAKDLRFVSLKRESYDGVWAGRALSTLKIEESQRVVAAFFQGLRPRTGVLFAIHPFAELGFESMLRQNGFNVLTQGKRGDEGEVIAVIARRI